MPKEAACILNARDSPMRGSITSKSLFKINRLAKEHMFLALGLLKS